MELWSRTLVTTSSAGSYRIRLYTVRMPKRIELSPHATTEELEHRYRKAKDPVERSHHQIVWLLSEGKRTEEVSEVTGYSPGWVCKIARRYNEGGWTPWATAVT